MMKIIAQNIKTNSLGFIEGWLSVGINILLFVLKYWIGVKANSVAMKADAWHTLSDTFTSLVVLFGFWISRRKPDEQHPFGHGRAEAIGAVIIGTLLFIVGATFFKESINRLIVRQGLIFSSLAIIIFLVSMVIKEGLASFSIWAGKKIDSQSLIADGWHHRSDAVASGLIVIGTVLGRYFWWIDGVAGILVSLLIFYATYDILKVAASTLIGERPDKSLKEKLLTVIHQVAPAVTDIHHLHVHKYGDTIELTFHIYFPEQIKLKEAHDIATTIEDAIKQELKMEATIHFEPLLSKGESMSKITSIELQYFDGCPHVAKARELVEHYQHEHPEVQIQYTRVTDNEHAAAIGFRGSPTILIDGKDLYQQPVPEEPRMACRFYPNGLPDYNSFVKMIQKVSV
jgi:cation diffusion facilitator family transporter